MKIRVIGASGFIGNYLLTSYKKRESELLPISLRSSEGLSKALKGVDVFLNLVGKAHDHKGTATEADYYFANVELAKQVFDAFIRSEASLLIHVSSLAAVEEFESNTLLKEEDACNPASWYGQSKREAEKWLMDQQLPGNKTLVILRPPMVHGPGDKGNLGLLYKLVSKGIPYPLASFENSRSFISIQNFTFFIEKIIERHNQLDSGIYHIADDQPMSTADIIEVIRKVTKKNTIKLALPKALVRLLATIGDIVPFPLNTKRLKKMTSNLLVSNQKIKVALGIDKLPFTAKEGLERTIRSFNEE